MQSVKCVVVGDNNVGKTSLLLTYVRQIFPGEYRSSFDVLSTKVNVENQTITLNLLDSAGSKDYDHIRPLSYNQVNVIIICFSITCPTSFNNVKLKWHPEIKQHCPGVPILLVGAKSDLRNDPQALEILKEKNQTTVTWEQGTRLAKQIKAVRYLECASINQDGLEEVFNEAVRASLCHSDSRTKPCVVL